MAAEHDRGKAIADAFASEGAKRAISDINEKGVMERAKAFESLGTACLGIRCDVTSVESVQQMFAQVVKKFGTVDLLVKNAALITNQPANTERRNRVSAYQTTPMPAAGARGSSFP